MQSRRSFLRAAAAMATASLLISTPAIASHDTKLSSYYGPGFHGNLMANGIRFDQHDPTTVAHKTLPFCTQVRVRGPNGNELTLVVRDRGPYHGNRELDVSLAAAQQLGFKQRGVANLTVLEITPPAKTHRYGKPCDQYLG